MLLSVYTNQIVPFSRGTFCCSVHVASVTLPQLTFSNFDFSEVDPSCHHHSALIEAFYKAAILVELIANVYNFNETVIKSLCLVFKISW